jgi:hypothetical protein
MVTPPAIFDFIFGGRSVVYVAGTDGMYTARQNMDGTPAVVLLPVGSGAHVTMHVTENAGSGKVSCASIDAGRLHTSTAYSTVGAAEHVYFSHLGVQLPVSCYHAWELGQPCGCPQGVTVASGGRTKKASGGPRS